MALPVDPLQRKSGGIWRVCFNDLVTACRDFAANRSFTCLIHLVFNKALVIWCPMKAFICTFCLFFASAFAAAGAEPVALVQDDRPLEEQRIRQAEEQALRGEAAYTSGQCGASISARIDWRRSGNWPNAGRGLARACDGALSAVEALCNSGQADKVRSKIRSFQCSGDGSGPSLSGTTLRFGASPGSNGFGQTRRYLEGAL